LKITEIKTIPLEMPLTHPFPGSTYSITKRCTLITEVNTDEGIAGVTFLGDNKYFQDAVIRIIREDFAPILIGEDPLCTERCWQKMFQVTLKQGDRARVAEAMGAVDTSLWDLLGKACNQPVHKLLGGYTDRLHPIIITGYYEAGKGPKDLAEEVKHYKEQGFAGAKVKVGGLSPLDDAKRVEAVREAVGADFIIGCDANQGWTRHEAVQFGLAVRDLGITWFEEPVHWYDEIQGMKYVRQHTGLSVSAGQSEFSYRGCRELVEGEAVDILNFDTSCGGGVTEWMRVAKMAETFQVRMAHHEEPLISMHLMGAIKHGLYPEYFSEVRDPMTPRLVKNLPKIANGWVSIPTAPGFGIELDEDFIRRYKVDL
jgi:L-alanine-DL-glutamate epimerase-like enolase superfamily enzyme